MALAEVWYCQSCHEYEHATCSIDGHMSFRIASAEVEILNYLDRVVELLEGLKRS